jgi:hypothetical protein
MVRVIVWWFFIILRFVIPLIFRLILFSLKLALMAFVSIWSGIPQATRRIADEWVIRAAIRKVPSEMETPLYYIFRGLAFLSIVAGWVVLSFLTVWAVNLVF